MKNFLITHRVWLITVGAGLVTFLTPSVQGFIAAHPQYAASVGTMWAVAAAWSKSPDQNK